MPELPEVESARLVLAQFALDRLITDVDDTDSWVCRPHAPGSIRAALVGTRLVTANRRGKSMWCETTGPALGIHLGMSGKLVFIDESGAEHDGGDYWQRGRAPGDHRFTRFALTFADGTELMLVDPRRLGRVRLDPPVAGLGPDALTITPAQFRAALARGTAPVKARLLDQEALAGVGNLLADQALWLAKLNPSRPVDELSPADVSRLHRAVRAAVTAAIEGGGVHTLSVIPSRREGGTCPRCGTSMQRATVGGRTTWWCPREQR
ncbi:Fpg/Nei family DNA glycosylase [Dactylosporangium matsuzakiense]|uniref:Formamidopyrimidine-DNA glycosylase n=1 Tax=Dactylosporangium matsuzakiense TaxID=53360 RepID=A0A9W6KPM1_9ACTN|nr:DNA-formamidopyrimidine glycosylase family protein [Dactylosporangium matsuzakiense]UWZ43925.1 formamidopyrimidine-DNA glycosylase [Dactylosporangium matsuzakiense]GLL03234.1 formamidopyrimidine-DNA glycosylase [Dactylosporangium matsuzakiense]